MKTGDQRLIEYVIEVLTEMPRADRVEALDLILSEFCPECGSADGYHCTCEEDE